MRRSDKQAVPPAHTIRIGSGGRFERRQLFREGALEVFSPHGARGPDLTLLGSLPPGLEGRVLVAGSREGLAALAVASGGGAEVLDFHLDAHDHARAAESIGRNGGKVQLAIGPDLPAAGELDWVVLVLARTGDSMLAGELVRQAHAALKPRGKVLAATDNPRDRWLHDRLLEAFGAVTIHRQNRSGSAYIARKSPDRSPRRRDFRRLFTARVFGQEIQLQSRPGVFSHGKLDEGTLALSEIAALPTGARVLDMGCGSGALGVAAARADGPSRAVLADAGARAVQVAADNARLNGVEDRTLTVLTSGFDCLAADAFDAVLANPPYFGDWRIAAMFAESGRRVLRRGGQYYMVARAGEVPREILTEVFGDVQASSRRGYTVLLAVKR